MPRRPKVQKQTVTVLVNGTPIAVILHPPTKARRSWYAYWNGLTASKSTGQVQLEDAIIVAENMLKNGGKQPVLADAVLTDEEFEAIQKAHFGRKRDPKEQKRAEKTFGKRAKRQSMPSRRSPASAQSHPQRRITVPPSSGRPFTPEELAAAASEKQKGRYPAEREHHTQVVAVSSSSV